MLSVGPSAAPKQHRGWGAQEMATVTSPKTGSETVSVISDELGFADYRKLKFCGTPQAIMEGARGVTAEVVCHQAVEPGVAPSGTILATECTS